jgi:16S rRNA processing protein RimM
MRKEDCFYLGKIAKNLVSREVLAYLDTDEPELYENLESVFVEYNKHLVLIENIPSKKIFFEFALKITPEAEADAMMGNDLYLPLKMLPKLSGDKFLLTK